MRTGLVVREATGEYALGPKLMALSRDFLSQADLNGAFMRLSRELKVLPNRTLVLSVRSETEVVYVGRRVGSSPLAVSYELGMRLPAHCTASGKALLCQLNREELKALYGPQGDGLTALTPKSITDLNALIHHLEHAAGRGYATDDEETALGMTCVGAPIFDAAGEAVGAVAVSLVKAATAPDELLAAESELCRLAAHISVAIGGRSGVFV